MSWPADLGRLPGRPPLATVAALLVALISGLAGPAAAAPEATAEGADAVIVLVDPGHGGSNRGALGPDGAQEKELTLAMARRLASLLEAQPGVRVLLTRDADHHVSLRERAEMANQVDAQLLISVHCNSAAWVGPRGHEVILLSVDGHQRPEHPGVLLQPLQGAQVGREALASAIEADLQAQGRHELSALAARSLHAALSRHLSGPGRGLRQGPYDVLIHAAVPAVVVEVGFLNHPQEGRRLVEPEFQQRAAEGMAEGVRAYLAASAAPAPDAAPEAPPVAAESTAPGASTAPSVAP